jgi:hypothetical protein
MKLKICTIYEVLGEIQQLKWLIDEGPAHEKLTESQSRLTALKDTLSTIEPDEIRRECDAKYEPIFRWLFGEEGDFPESKPGHRYNWRKQLREKLAAIVGKDERE